jgi:hypothetical protein
MIATLLTLQLLSADAGTEVRPTRGNARDSAMAGLLAAGVAGTLTVAVAVADGQHTRSEAPLVLGAIAFGLVAFVRPVAFFGAQSAKPPKTYEHSVLRIIGTLTAVSGLAAFIAHFALRTTSDRDAANWALVPAAGLEAVSVAAFGADAWIAATEPSATPAISAAPSGHGGVTVSAGVTGHF